MRRLFITLHAPIHCHALDRVSGRFDLICNFENIEHLQRPERFLQHAARLLAADDGVLLCSTPDRDGPYQPWQNGRPCNPYHVTEWYADEFERMLLAWFEDVEVRAQVMSHAAVQRADAAHGLVRHLDYSWANPLLRAPSAPPYDCSADACDGRT